MEKRLLYFGKFQTIQRNRLPKMGVFIAHDFFGDDDSAREGYRTMFDDAFVSTNYMPLYATGELRTILDTVAPNLINAEAGIFDVSTHRKYNANVLIELGMALGLNYPTVVIAEDDGEPLLDFLEALKPLRYHKRRDLIDQLPDALNEIVNTDQLLGESYCVICRQDTCSCRKRIHQQVKNYMLVGTHVEDDEVDIDVKAAVRDLKLERLIYEDGLATNLCGWLYTMRRSRFIFFYSKPLGKSHHGAENAATMVQLGMAIGSALPWGIIVPPGEFGPTDVSSILSIRADKNPKNFRSQLKNAAAFLLQEHNPFHGIYDPLEPPLEVPIEEDDRSIDDEPLTSEVRLYNVPPLSDSVFPDEKVEELIERLLQGNSSVVISGEPSIASIGKTRLAIIACHSESVQAYFSNGIYWLHLGDENPLTTACDQLYDIYDLISSKPITRIEPFDLQGLQRITGLINNITRDGSHLFVIDHIHDANIFDVLEGLNTGQNRVLYTSRDQWIASRTPSILVMLDDPTVVKNRLDVPPLSNPPFGLERDVNAVYDLLADEQIVVIQGSAGSGKTTLATLVCQDSRTQALFPDGIFWIRAGRITSLDDLTLYSQLIARELGVEETTRASLSTGLGPVANRKFLIVIDGFDEIPTTPDIELSEAALKWFTNSSSSGSTYKVLVTSREYSLPYIVGATYRLKRTPFNGERVFIWYVRKDARDVAQELYEKLAEIGLNPWLDAQSIRGGSDWHQEISNALDAADAFIVLMTPGVHESKWFKPELQLALEQKIPILPLLVQDTELPTELKTISYIDFRTNREREFMRLVDALGRILHAKPSTRIEHDKKRIFIAYVRRDTSDFAQALADRLRDGYEIFLDFTSIPLGVDFADFIKQEISQVDILVCIISPNAIQSQWWIRELEWALEMNKRIIPVLVDDHKMPAQELLPIGIRQLASLSAIRLRSQNLPQDISLLVQAVESENRDEQLLRQLIAQLSSPQNDEALAALSELRSRGNLTDGTMQKISLHGANLQNANFNHAVFNTASFVEANLRNADFQSATLTKTSFVKADMQNANLSNIDADGTSFNGANLTGALLAGANLRNSSLYSANLMEAIFNEHTILPDGTSWSPMSDLARFTDPAHPDFWQPANLRGEVRLTDRIYISYAQQDKYVVDLFRQMQANVGLKTTEEPVQTEGDSNSNLKLIEEATIFWLFWSENAAQSRRVQEELRYALELQNSGRERFIRPIYWTRPMPEPPAELIHLHFQFLEIDLSVEGVLDQIVESLSSDIRHRFALLSKTDTNRFTFNELVSLWKVEPPEIASTIHELLRFNLIIEETQQTYRLAHQLVADYAHRILNESARAISLKDHTLSSLYEFSQQVRHSPQILSDHSFSVPISHQDTQAEVLISRNGDYIQFICKLFSFENADDERRNRVSRLLLKRNARADNAFFFGIEENDILIRRDIHISDDIEIVHSNYLEARASIVLFLDNLDEFLTSLIEDISGKSKESTTEVDVTSHQSYDPSLLSDKSTIPQIELVEIPSGEFLMGQDNDSEDVRPQHRVQQDRFLISKYPITQRQFSYFIIAGGYEQQRFWTSDGWQLVQKLGLANVIRTPHSGLSEQMLAQVQEGKFPPPSQSVEGNLPMVSISWYEAKAYCRWMSEITGQYHDLPHEAQWEKAARGTQGLIYPYGNEFDPAKCNTSEGSVRRITDVTRYPQGSSPYGVTDMSGNVWEWTNSLYRPYVVSNTNVIRSDVSEGERIVKRGGSFSNDRLAATTFSRVDSNPSERNNNVGFRVIVS